MIFSNKSDKIGIWASGLCFIHCLFTPFLFVVQSCTAVCCAETPIWWRAIDYFFLGISFFAIWFSSKSSRKVWVISILWINWVLLALIILFEEFVNALTFDHVILVPAIGLIALHYYNKKFCCEDEECRNAARQ